MESTLKEMLKSGYRFCREIFESGEDLPMFALVRSDDIFWLEWPEKIEIFLEFETRMLALVASSLTKGAVLIFSTATQNEEDCLLVCVLHQDRENSLVMSNRIHERTQQLSMDKTLVVARGSFSLLG